MNWKNQNANELHVYCDITAQMTKMSKDEDVCYILIFQLENKMRVNTLW